MPFYGKIRFFISKLQAAPRFLGLVGQTFLHGYCTVSWWGKQPPHGYGTRCQRRCGLGE